jgi:hypothetical protein
MWVIPVIAVLILAAVMLNRFLTRETAHPLERHERALEALRELSEKPRPVVRDLQPPPALPSEHIRILPDTPDEAPKRRPRSRRPVTSARSRRAASRTVQPDPVELPVIPIGNADVEALPRTPAPPAPPPAEPAAAVAPGVQELPVPPPSRWAESSGSWPSRRVASAVGVGVAVAATLAGALLITTANGHGGAKGASSRPPAQAAAAPRTTVPAPTTTPTTAATLVGQLVALPTGDASVSVRGPFTLALQATGRCWVQVTGANGQTLFEGTLQQGEVQMVSGVAPLTVRLGNTRGIALRVDGSNLDLAGVANTANVNFQTG